LYRLFTFSYKLINDDLSPTLLKDQLKANATRGLTLNLRNKNELIVDSAINNNYGELTFSHFFLKFYNHFFSKICELSFSNFKQYLQNNINLLFVKFSDIFPKFNIFYKQIYISSKFS